MAAGATVDIVAMVDELGGRTVAVDIVVLHLPMDALGAIDKVAPAVADDTRIVCIIPTSSLEITVELLKSTRVAAVLVADTFDPAALAAVASRLVHGDVFGLEKIVPWGVKVYSTLVGDYQEKSVAIAAASDFAGSMGVRH